MSVAARDIVVPTVSQPCECGRAGVSKSLQNDAWPGSGRFLPASMDSMRARMRIPDEWRPCDPTSVCRLARRLQRDPDISRSSSGMSRRWSLAVPVSAPGFASCRPIAPRCRAYVKCLAGSAWSGQRRAAERGDGRARRARREARGRQETGSRPDWRRRARRDSPRLRSADPLGAPEPGPAASRGTRRCRA